MKKQKPKTVNYKKQIKINQLVRIINLLIVKNKYNKKIIKSKIKI